MTSRPPSFSEPGYSCLFIGAWPDVSDGPAVNLDYELIPTWTQDNLFSAANRAGLKTAISGFNWFQKLVPQDAVSVSFYTAGEDQAADRQVRHGVRTGIKRMPEMLRHFANAIDEAPAHAGSPSIRSELTLNKATSLVRNLECGGLTPLCISAGTSAFEAIKPA